MSRFSFGFGLALVPAWLLAAGCAESHAVRDLSVLRRAPLYTFNEQEVDGYLRWLSEARPRVPDRVALLARQNIGQPYRIFLLGEAPFELYDPDPLYCLTAGDCVTFVEHTYAMALSRDWPSFFRTLLRLRYKDGKIGILTRNHFTEADWNVNNAWLFDDVSASLAGGGARPMRVRIDRASFFARIGVTHDVPVEVFEDRFIPRDRLPDVLGELRDGDVVQFVRGNDRFQYVGHIGLIFHDPAGSVTLLHATAPVAREEALTSYIEQHPKIRGLKVLRMVESPDDGDRRRDSD